MTLLAADLPGWLGPAGALAGVIALLTELIKLAYNRNFNKAQTTDVLAATAISLAKSNRDELDARQEDWEDERADLRKGLADEKKLRIDAEKRISDLDKRLREALCTIEEQNKRIEALETQLREKQ